MAAPSLGGVEDCAAFGGTSEPWPAWPGVEAGGEDACAGDPASGVCAPCEGSPGGGDAGDLVLQDLATRKLLTIKAADIEVKTVTGSVMPRGLTAVLSRQQQLDLVRYLSDLGKIR